MQKKIIQRFGINDLGADPNWIVKVRLIEKNEKTPPTWEAITNTELKTQLGSQYSAFTLWKTSQPLPIRNFNLKQEKLAIKVTNNPTESYRIYKYLSSDIIDTRNIDVTQPPHSILYDKQLSVKVYEDYTVNKGLKTSVVVKVINDDGSLGEEILKGTIGDYVFDLNSGPIPASESMASRITIRQWIKEDGTYLEDESDVKISPKLYLTKLQKNNEGKKRRESIFTDLQDFYGLVLFLYKTNGDVTKANNIGKRFLRKISSDVIDYINTGSDVILEELSLISDETTDIDKFGLHIPITSNPTINQTYPETVGLTLLKALEEKFKGNI